jgi:hypothetical protein
MCSEICLQRSEDVASLRLGISLTVEVLVQLVPTHSLLPSRISP